MKTSLLATVFCAVLLVVSDHSWAQCELSEPPALLHPHGSRGPVAVDGDRLVVGSGTELHVYGRSSSGWALEDAIPLNDVTPNGSVSPSAYGRRLDISGDRIIVMVTWLEGGPPCGGACIRHDDARIYRRETNGWVVEQVLPIGAGSVGIDGDLAAVATQNSTEGEIAVIAYRRSGQSWVVDEEFVLAGEPFTGYSLRPIVLDNGVLVIADYTWGSIVIGGAPRPFSEAGSSQRLLSCFGTQGDSMFVFRRTPAGWQSEGTLPNVPSICDGIEIAIEGDIIAGVGDEFSQSGTTFSVVLYRYGAGAWNFEQTVHPSIPTPPNSVQVLPLSLDIAGGRVVAGFHSNDHAGTDAGIAFLIEEVEGEWMETARLVASDAAAADGLGYGVATNGTEAFIAAPGRDPDGINGAGAVYVYDIADCDGNGSPDQCPNGCTDPVDCADCNSNGTADGCDRDCDGNSVPDDCECVQLPFFTDVVAPCCNNRFVEVVLPDSCQKSAARVKMVSLYHPTPPGPPPVANFAPFEAGANCIEGPDGCVRWAGTPGTYVDSVLETTVFNAAMLSCNPQYHDWGGQMIIALTGAEIISSSVYEVQFLDEGCDPAIESNYSAPVIVETNRWGDVAAPYQDPVASTPNQPTAIDIAAVVDKVKDAPGSMPRVGAELSSQLITLSMSANAQDIGAAVDAVKGKGYAFAAPGVCQ